MIDIEALKKSEKKAAKSGHVFDLEAAINFMAEPDRTKFLDFLDQYEELEDVVMWCLRHIKKFDRSKVEPRLHVVKFSEMEEAVEHERNFSEVSYRKGYLHGYDSAMDDMKKAHKNTDEAWNTVVKFFDGELSSWRYVGGFPKYQEPPRFQD